MVSANPKDRQAGTVQLTYWPTGDNYTYPSTFYDASLDYTL
jgi:hypothetical protein